MTTDLGSIEDDTLDILTLRNGSSKYLIQNAYNGVCTVSVGGCSWEFFDHKFQESAGFFACL